MLPPLFFVFKADQFPPKINDYQEDEDNKIIEESSQSSQEDLLSSSEQESFERTLDLHNPFFKMLTTFSSQRESDIKHLERQKMNEKDKQAYCLLEEIFLERDFQSSVQLFELLTIEERDLLLCVCQAQNPHLFRTPLHMMSDLGRCLEVSCEKMQKKISLQNQEQSSCSDDLPLEQALLEKKKRRYYQALPIVTQMIVNFLKKHQKLQDCLYFHTLAGHNPLSCAIASNIPMLTEHLYALLSFESFKIRVPYLFDSKKSDLELAFQTGNVLMIKIVYSRTENKNFSCTMVQSALCFALLENFGPLKWFCRQKKAKNILREYFLEPSKFQYYAWAIGKMKFFSYRDIEKKKVAFIKEILEARESADFKAIFSKYKEFFAHDKKRRLAERRKSEFKDKVFQMTLENFSYQSAWEPHAQEEQFQALKNQELLQLQSIELQPLSDKVKSERKSKRI